MVEIQKDYDNLSLKKNPIIDIELFGKLQFSTSDLDVGFLESMIQKYEDDGVSEWGIVYKENNKFIGTCGYLWWNSTHALNRKDIYTTSST